MVCIVLWVAIALHTALAMRRYGRRWWVWLPISIVFSAIPALIVSLVDYLRHVRRQRDELAGGPPRCRHCGELLTSRNLRQVGGHSICAGCGMVVETEDLA